MKQRYQGFPNPLWLCLIGLHRWGASQIERDAVLAGREQINEKYLSLYLPNYGFGYNTGRKHASAAILAQLEGDGA